jgi:hypothetical protein
VVLGGLTTYAFSASIVQAFTSARTDGRPAYQNSSTATVSAMGHRQMVTLAPCAGNP